MVFAPVSTARSGAAPARAASKRLVSLAVRLLPGAAALAFALIVAPAGAEERGALLTQGKAEAGWWGRSVALELQIGARAPFRVFTLDAPPRLVIDVEGAFAAGFDPAPLVAGPVEAARAGPVRPGWARLVLDLSRPMTVETAELRDTALEVALRRAGAGEFSARSGPPPGVWAPGADRAAPAPRGAGPVTVAIDAGHGGPDPGAVRDGVEEKSIALAFARALSAALAASPRFRVILTREDDRFLGLAERVARARAAGADVFLSIHTNVADDPATGGAIVFTRSEAGSDASADRRAQLENRADLAGGFEAEAGDPVAALLDDLARLDTVPRAEALAAAVVAGLDAAGLGFAPFPRRSARFVVLGAPDIPSALIELGFLSNPDDRARMEDPAWQARAAAALAAGLGTWIETDAALAARLGH